MSGGRVKDGVWESESLWEKTIVILERDTELLTYVLKTTREGRQGRQTSSWEKS